VAADSTRLLGGLSSSELKAIDLRTRQIGEEIFRALRRPRSWVFQRRWWNERIMNWSMSDERLKVQLFRFVDVLPMLGDSQTIARRLGEYLQEAGPALGRAGQWGLGVAEASRLTRWMLAKAARFGAADFARRFIAGSTTDEVVQAAFQQRRRDRAFTLDILGEAVTSQVEADRFFGAYVNLIESVAPAVYAWPANPRLDRDAFGPLPRMNLSIKLSALDCHFDPIDSERVIRRTGERLKELLRVARRHQAFVNVDMESYDKKDLTLAIFRHVLDDPEFRDFVDVGIVLQCYLTETENDLVALRDWARRRGAPVWVRLVKGAYWDYETILAHSEGWPIPVYQEKWQSDANYERQMRFALANTDCLRTALGSHNLRSLAHGIAVAEHLGLARDAYEIQMLYGMADAEKDALVERGQRLRVYMPYGDLIPGMAYLVRRLLENTSNDSFLRAGLQADVDVAALLSDPETAARRPSVAAPALPHADNGQPTGSHSNHDHSDNDPGNNMTTSTMPAPAAKLRATFRNEPLADFSRPANRQTMTEALALVRSRLGRRYPLVIDGREIMTDETVNSLNPGCHREVVGIISRASREQVDQAVAAARRALPDWSAAPTEVRAKLLTDAAQVMRDRKFELAAWCVLECGKQWREADADICEAIDFCEYYADAALALSAPQGADIPGEENRFGYLPRGVTGIIAPWNFPLAILTGMATAALVTGNTILIKPAEPSSVIGALLVDILQSVGAPPGVVNFVPGRGQIVGDRIVEHPGVAMIAFTGSRAVGLAINAKAAQVSAQPTSKIVKHVIAEMGGKNAIIVDADADLDEAVLGIIKSAFGYQGQKCSACSRLIVLDAVHDTLVDRLIEAARSIVIAPAEDPSSQVGAVIDAAAQQRINEYIAIGHQEGRAVVATDPGPLKEQGYFVGPHIFVDVAPDARIAQEEIFGPVLAVIRVKDLDEAIRVANGTDYALTGGMYSRSPENLDRVRRELLVGNVYLNRPITGALVGRQPFGGFKMSGIGTKAGGRDYLLQFVLPRTVTENTMRRGFAPLS
jgi:RHH-type proline utilization regulon transcriptional repressor/proline dehydrogenase/delta 1-pyrroline-5-carboxylate dehydrogenase